MAQVCDICGKGPQFGNTISHAHNVSRRRWNVNLRPVRAKVKGGAKRKRVFTASQRSGKVVNAKNRGADIQYQIYDFQLQIDNWKS
jgi:large subunit ribosomal protein L28